MDTEVLEKQAMNKIYNSTEPDELIEKTVVIQEEGNRFSLVPSILTRHGEDLVLENYFIPNDFSYLLVESSSWQWHFLKFFNNSCGMVLPIDYIIEYASTSRNSKLYGTIIFRKEKEYVLEYRKATLEEFYAQMKELEDIFLLLEDFQTENNQLFREYKEDAIYMYQEGYIWKVTGYSRNDITEYYDMYLLLMSLRPLTDGVYKDCNQLKFLYLVSKNAITYLYKGIDLKKRTPASLIEEFQKTLDVVTVSLENRLYKEVLDLDYSIARRRNYPKEEEVALTITHKEKWFFDGNFSLGLFGNYLRGELFEFPSILSSKELSEPEKKELIKKVVMEKKQECLEKKAYLDNQFLIAFFKDRMENAEEFFDQENWIDFLKLENISLEELSRNSVKDWFIQKLQGMEPFSLDSEEWNEFCTYIDYSAIKSKVKPLYLTITPLFIVLEYALFGKKENFILTEEYEMISWK